MKLKNIFLSRLVIKPYYISGAKNWDGRTWELAKPMIIEVVLDDETIEISIEKGWLFDGGSIPDFYQGRARSLGKGLFAFTVHDALYNVCAFERKKCDKIMLELLKFFEFGWSRRNAIFYSVRTFGGLYFDKSPEQIEKNGKYVKVLTFKNK